MFLFQISSYDDMNLDAETEELFRQRLEAHSRRTVPGIWKAVDHMNAYAARGPGRQKRQLRYRIYGIFLLALGIFALVPGLAEPRVPALIWAGAFAIFAGIINLLCSHHKERPAKNPPSCQKAAKTLLEGRRAVDWSKSPVKVNFDSAGMSVCTGENQKQEIVSYGRMTGIYETEHLWLLIYDNEKALLLQKKDLVSGRADAFSSQILQKIREKG